MTFSLFLRCYGATVIGIMLLIDLSFPFEPLRNFLKSGPYVAKGAAGWATVVPNEHGPDLVTPAGSKWQARAKVGPLNLVRSWGSDLISCGWCTGAWVSAFFILVSGAGLVWWPALWCASSATVVILDRIADH